jgi:hypothetical protein
MDKRAKLLEAKSLPYKSGLKPNTKSSKIHEEFGSKSKEELSKITTDFCLAGRC